MILSIRLTFKTFGMTKFALLLSNSLKENRENQINFFFIPHTPFPCQNLVPALQTRRLDRRQLGWRLASSSEEQATEVW